MKPRPAILRKASALLREVADEKPVDVREAQRLAEQLAPRARSRKVLPFPTRKEAKAEKDRKHRIDTEELLLLLQARARGICEVPLCGALFTALNPAELDHWEGGSGRRRQNQSPETCWLPCRNCHRARTHNRPSTEKWNELRRIFCEAKGFPFQPHVEHRAVQRR